MICIVIIHPTNAKFAVIKRKTNAKFHLAHIHASNTLKKIKIRQPLIDLGGNDSPVGGIGYVLYMRWKSPIGGEYEGVRREVEYYSILNTYKGKYIDV
jgi:hypothetical protein